MPDNVVQSRLDGAEFDSINVNVMPVVLVPGVMGSRLRLAGPNWDPDDKPEVLKLVFLRQRSLANLLDARRPGSIFQTLGATGTQQVDTNPPLVLRAQALNGQSAGAPPGGAGGTGGASGTGGGGGASSNTGNVPANPVASRFYGTQRGWAGVAWDFYGDVLMKLEERFLDLGNFPVYAIGYDWRQSARVGGAVVLQQLRAILQREGAQKALIVTHSMGGLVVRSAIQQGGTSLIQGVVHCVMPAHGAVVAYRRFHTGATDVLDSPNPTAAPSPIPNVPGLVLDRILGLTPIEYTVTQANLPGPLELLPTNDYPDVFIRFPVLSPDPSTLILEANTTGANSLVTPPLADIYSLYQQNQQPGIVPNAGDKDGVSLIPVPAPAPLLIALVPLPGDTVTAADVASLTRNIGNARAFHASVRNLVHPNSAFLIGDIINTDTQLDFTRTGGGPTGTRIDPAPPGPSGAGGAPSVDPNDPTSTGGSGSGPQSLPGKISVTAAMAIKRPAGDGTVPSASARFTSAGSKVFRRTFAVQHSECFKDSAFRKEVKQQLLKFAGLPPDRPDQDDIV